MKGIVKMQRGGGHVGPPLRYLLGCGGRGGRDAEGGVPYGVHPRQPGGCGGYVSTAVIKNIFRKTLFCGTGAPRSGAEATVPTRFASS